MPHCSIEVATITFVSPFSSIHLSNVASRTPSTILELNDSAGTPKPRGKKKKTTLSDVKRVDPKTPSARFCYLPFRFAASSSLSAIERVKTSIFPGTLNISSTTSETSFSLPFCSSEVNFRTSTLQMKMFNQMMAHVRSGQRKINLL